MLYDLLTQTMNTMGVLALFQRMNIHNFSILMYHGIRKDSDKKHLSEYSELNVPMQAFTEQMKYIQKKYHVLSMSEIVHHIQADEPFAPHSLAITFDDGYLNNYLYAYPICKKLNIPFTIYVATNFINNQDLLWTDRLLLAFSNTKQTQLSINIKGDDYSYVLQNPRDKDQAHLDLLQKLKQLNTMKIHETLNEVEARLDIQPEHMDTSPLRPCSWKELYEMANSGLVEIGAHTAGHHILTQLSETECKNELNTSKEQVEKNLKRQCNHFAYPNGRTGDFNSYTEKWIKEAGFSSAVTTVEGFNNHTSNPLVLNRLGIYGHYSHSEFVSMISGFHSLLAKILYRK